LNLLWSVTTKEVEGRLDDSSSSNLDDSSAIRSCEPARVRNVLVAYHGSEAARRALTHAADLARPDDRLTIVNVMPDPGVSAAIGPPSEQLRQEQALDDARRFLAERGLQARTLALIGNAASEILAAAEQVDADVVVLARRRGPASHLLGSTSSHVVRSAKCDVLVVHEGEGSP
jgi:nucleotide-binding universal stress UspA family protein